MNYKGFSISDNYQMTSTNPGGGTLSVAEAISKSVDIEEILAYKNDAVVFRISKDLKIDSKKAEELFVDVKKFLWVAANSNEDRVPSPLIDEAWHCFILFTKDYNEFCIKYFGQFLHHLPHRPGDPFIGLNTLKPTIDSIINYFGEKPSSNWDYINLN